MSATKNNTQKKLDNYIMTTRNKLITLIKNCLDILRDSDSLTGEKALRNLGYHLNLRLLEKEFGKTIDIDNYTNYSFEKAALLLNSTVTEVKERSLKAARYSNLAKEGDNTTNIINIMWNVILSVHPDLSPIFPKGKMFDIKRSFTHQKIIKKFLDFNFEEIEEDILGEAYEEVIKDIMTGKVLGQFFTPPVIKNLVIDIINPQLKPDGTTETVFDPAMGTGGFLISSLRHIIKQSKAKNIPINWDFVKHQGLGGRETEPDTYQLAMSNMLISSGRLFNTLELEDSIRKTITNKYDIVVANPPFGIKGLNYDEIRDSLKFEYLPIKSKNAVSLFLQAIIYILKVGGRCGVVLPDGQDLFATSSDLIMVREFLMKTCDLKEVIHLPANAFSNTSIKTCIFIFSKIRDGKDVLTRTVKKIRGRETDIFTMSKEHQTSNVMFYSYDFEMKSKTLLANVPIADIAKNNYSLSYSQYVKKEEVKYADGIVVKTLGEVCDFEIGGTPSRSIKEYYKGGSNLWVSVSELNRGYITDTKEKITDDAVKNSSVKLFDVNTILMSFKLSIGKTAIVGKPMYSNEAIAGINTKDNNVITNKYLYHYLSNNNWSHVGQGVIGGGSLNKQSLTQIKIPIPPLETQKEIVEICDFNESLIKKYEELIEINKRTAKIVINNVLGVNTQEDEITKPTDDEIPTLKGVIRLKKIIPADE